MELANLGLKTERKSLHQTGRLGFSFGSSEVDSSNRMGFDRTRRFFEATLWQANTNFRIEMLGYEVVFLDRSVQVTRSAHVTGSNRIF